MAGAGINAFMPLALQHLDGLPDDNILRANIRRAIGELCLAAPIFPSCATISTATETVDMSPYVAAAVPEDDTGHEWELGSVLELRIGDRPIQRQARRAVVQPGGIGWDADTDAGEIYLRGIAAPDSGRNGVWARRPNTSSPRPQLPGIEFYIPDSRPIFGTQYAFGGTADAPANIYTLRSAAGAATASAPPGDEWALTGVAPDIGGWRVFAPGGIPDGWVQAGRGNETNEVSVVFSIAPMPVLSAAGAAESGDSRLRGNGDSDLGETYPDVLLKKYGGAIAAGALARMPLANLGPRTPGGYWERKWQMERSGIIGRLMGSGARQIQSGTGLSRNFPRTGFRSR